jgi:DNA helicase HerA-like ATPase
MILEMPDYGQHIVFLGSTGSGKSHLAEAMLNEYSRYVGIDTQDSLAVNGAKLKNPNFLKQYLWLYKRIHYVPNPDYMNRLSWDFVLRTLAFSSTKKKPKPKIVYIDEIYHLGFNQNFPVWLPKAVATCRQKQISFWISTQRPKMIPVATISEASRIFIFYLSRGEDIEYISKFARRDRKGFEKALLEQKNDYSFIEVNNRLGTWQKFNKIGG